MATVVTEPGRQGVYGTRETVVVSRSPGDHEVHALLIPVAADVDRVIIEGDLVGFLHQAGPVFVALKGPDLARAVEVAQSRDLGRAVTALVWPGE